MPALAADERIAAVRRFNRFYTRQIGVLGETMLKSPYSLTEARVLYELATRDRPTASGLCADLGLDAGYLSRILARFARDGLIRKTASKVDARQNLIAITAKGRKAYAPLETLSQNSVAGLLAPLSAGEQREVIGAMRTIERLVDRTAEQQDAAQPPYVLRGPRPGDLGWIVARHGVLYAQQFNWNAEFEALAAQIVAEFAKNFDPLRERCWIAERNGENVGSVFVQKGSDTTAKLRLLLVEPSARGIGIGAALVDACIRFARAHGYRDMTLWTQANLIAPRRIYAAAGFKLARSEPHHAFGHDLISEHWDLVL